MTYLLPGPTILSTRGTSWVPKAKEPMAQGPPILKRRCAPARWAATRVAGLTAISGPGGVAAKISLTPATRAGMIFIRALEG